MTEQEKLSRELDAINRTLELARTQPEAVAKIQDLEAKFSSALTVRVRWRKEAMEASGREKQLRDVLAKLPAVIEERELAFERIAFFDHGISPGSLNALHRYERETDALRVSAHSAKERIRTAATKTSRAELLFNEADNLAGVLAGEINSAKRDLRNLIKADRITPLAPGQELDEIRWLSTTVSVPAL